MTSSWKSKLTSSLFVLPYLACFAVFLLYPIVYGIVLSLQKYDMLQTHQFVGFKNYVDLFTPGTYSHDQFVRGLLGTVKFVVYSVPVLIVVGLAMALLVNALPSRGRGLFRTVYFLPYAVSATVMATIWIRVFDTDTGFINLLFDKLHIHRQQHIGWFTDTPWVWIALVLSTVWWTIGFNMMLFINGLNEVPEEMYEAATLDGANAWQKLMHITLPSIKNVSSLVVIMTVIASFNVFAQPNLMTRGGPGSETTVLIMNIFDVAYGQHQGGAASAMALMLGVIMIVVSVVLNRLLFRKEG
ncbi:carbohydrate ABC transporter permease [Paenibacillus humicola]|uniref:carbohydrate ABC transporter permease n=1 Tax=Paenibacillus humicola TaxID=3110540 RepID=UPI00237B1CAE|nr:sugar ABC transporter permease [Paenibacillus humicola]